MNAKLSVLRACRTVLRPGGRLAFLTITIPDGLSRSAHRRAALAGPPAAAARQDSCSLLSQAKFRGIREIDKTAEYAATVRAWYDAAELHRVELRGLDPQAYDDKQRDRRRMFSAINDGLLRRSLLIAER